MLVHTTHTTLLARLRDGAAGNIRLRLGGPNAEDTALLALPVTFEPGIVGRLLAQERPGAWLLSAADRGGAALEATTVDPQQEEALRALGYLQ